MKCADDVPFFLMLEMVGEMKAEKHTPEYMKETKMERK